MHSFIQRAASKVLFAPVRRFSTLSVIKGNPTETDENSVKLRGVYLKSDNKQAHNLIFFPEFFDKVENWVPFFSNPQNKIIQQRNVYILYPRNIGTSDRAEEVNYTSMADDLARFMAEHRIQNATIGGHGLGGKLALVSASYHFDKVTGVIALDTAPLNQCYIEAYRELGGYLEALRHIDINRSLTAINAQMKRIVKCPKWRDVFEDQLVKTHNGFAWNFALEPLAKNINSKTQQSLLNWSENYGLWPGRALFAFPEYSRFVFLNSHTNKMLSFCPQLKQFNEDIFAIQGDENPLNHWIYDYEDQAEAFGQKIAHFLRHYDGVNLKYKNRMEEEENRRLFER